MFTPDAMNRIQIQMIWVRPICLLVTKGKAPYKTLNHSLLFMKRPALRTSSEKLEFTIAHRPRVTKRLHLELDEKGGLVIVAPRHWSRAHISATLSQNNAKVARFLANARQRLLPPLQYVQGEKHLYLGETYSLVILRHSKRKSRFEISDQVIQITTANPEPAAIQSALLAWYRRQALRVFSERMKVIAQKAPWAAKTVVPLKLRSMRRTWGNCSSKGVIKLNTHLIKTPLSLVDSVIAHELCHLEEMNHSRAFYSLLENLNPDWQQDRAMLRSQGYIYLRS
jgi:predicted metal-dependent hydrolase